MTSSIRPNRFPRITKPYHLILLVVLCLNGQAMYGLHTETVRYQQGDTELQSYLAYDDQRKGKRPGILVVHEWWGLNDNTRKRAEALAKAGYIALALDMYGNGKQTSHPDEAGEWSHFIAKNKDIGKARFLAAYDLLRNHDLTSSNNIAAIGYCFGGATVLTMAQEGIDLQAVVSFHGSLPVVKTNKAIPAAILVCHGDDDPFVTEEQIRTFQDHLRQRGADWQFIRYGGAKHSFTVPEADRAGIPALAYQPQADRRSWEAMLSLFEEVFTP